MPTVQNTARSCSLEHSNSVAVKSRRIVDFFDGFVMLIDKLCACKIVMFANKDMNAPEAVKKEKAKMEKDGKRKGVYEAIDKF